MSSAAKASEPTMEEILASIRRIIADDEPATESSALEPASKAPAMKVVEAAPAPEEPAGEMSQDDIDAMLASFDSPALPDDEPAAEPEDTAAEAEAEPSLDEWGLAEEEENVLELTDPVDAGKASAFDDDVEFRDRVVEDRSDDASASDLSALGRDLAAGTGESLLDAEVGRRIAGSFGSLNDMIFAQNARTIEDLIQEMLRPMLKGWLDDNLPQIVERMVRAEIERVSRGRR